MKVSTLKRSFRTISPFPIYFFASCKLILLACAEIFFGSKFLLSSKYFVDHVSFATIQNLWFFRYVMLTMGIVSLVNLKYQNFKILILSTLFFCFWWSYITIGLGLANHFTNLHVLGLAIETIAMIYLTYSVCRFKNLPCLLNNFKIKNF